MGTAKSLSSEALASYRQAFRKRTRERFLVREKHRQQAREVIVATVRIIMPQYPPVRRVYLFGSITKPGAFGPSSDIDIGIEGVGMGLCFDIWRDLEQVASDWQLDIRSLDPEDVFSKRVHQKGELIYEQPVTDS
jgi:predicted nucleotidyltransferase